jgi:hypothetical protein
MASDIKSSNNMEARNLKIMLWGGTGKRKTETPLRFFPDVCVFDAEGNVEQCKGMKEIPEFLYIVSKDTRRLLRLIDEITTGKLKMPNGNPVQTLVVDSETKLWSVQQEVASVLAEKRAAKWKKDPLEATTTPLDWTIAKRPLKELLNKIDGSSIKYLFIIAREKDMFEEGKGVDLKKIGVTPDAVKGTEFEMNISFYMGGDPEWYCKVSKVQGALGYTLPEGKVLRQFPTQILMDHTKGAVARTTIADDDLARQITDEIDTIGGTTSEPHTQGALLQYAKGLGMETKDVGPALKTAGITEFSPAKWDEMKAALLKASEIPPEDQAALAVAENDLVAEQ